MSAPTEIFYILWRGLEWLHAMKKKKKNGEATEGRGSKVKGGEMLHEEEACENPAEWSSMCDGRIETVEYIW